MAAMGLSKEAQKAPLFAACVAGILAGYVVLRRWWWSRKLPPGSMGWPLLGETLSYVSGQEEFIAARLLKYGGTFKSNVLFVPTVFLAVTESNAKLIHSKRDLGWPAHFKKVMGETSVPMVNDPLHKRLRNMSTRAFTNQQLDLYLPVLHKLSAKYLKEWAAQGTSEPRDVYFQIKKYAFECGQAVILGSAVTESELDHFMHLFDTAIGGLGCVLPVDLPGFPFHTCMSARRQLGLECHKVIQRRREALQASPQPTCMLDAMLGSEEGTSDLELQDFCVSMTFAGHDTTLASIHTTLRWLKQCPELAAGLRAEVDEIWDGSAPITRGLLESIPKTRAFIQEVWRKTPPVSPIVRNLAEDQEVDGFVVPKGWNLSYYPARQFSKADDWDEFRPSRHLDEEGQFIDSTHEATLFESFGGGSRMCIGYKFARDEMLTFLMVFLKHYDMSLASSTHTPFPFNFYRLEGSFCERAAS